MAQTTVNVLKDGDAQVGAFGCNGASPQTAVEAPAAAGATYTAAEQTLLNTIRSALIANGILVDAV